MCGVDEDGCADCSATMLQRCTNSIWQSSNSSGIGADGSRGNILAGFQGNVAPDFPVEGLGSSHVDDADNSLNLFGASHMGDVMVVVESHGRWWVWELMSWSKDLKRW